MYYLEENIREIKYLIARVIFYVYNNNTILFITNHWCKNIKWIKIYSVAEATTGKYHHKIQTEMHYACDLNFMLIDYLH